MSVSDCDLDDISARYTRRSGAECVKMRDGHQAPDDEIGSARIVVDLELDDADKLSTHTALGIQVMKPIREAGLRQKEAGKLPGLKQPDVSAIMRAKFSRFSQERLIGFLNKLEQKVTIHVSRHHRGEPYQQVMVAR